MLKAANAEVGLFPKSATKLKLAPLPDPFFLCLELPPDDDAKAPNEGEALE